MVMYYIAKYTGKSVTNFGLYFLMMFLSGFGIRVILSYRMGWIFLICHIKKIVRWIFFDRLEMTDYKISDMEDAPKEIIQPKHRMYKE